MCLCVSWHGMDDKLGYRKTDKRTFNASELQSYKWMFAIKWLNGFESDWIKDKVVG